MNYINKIDTFSNEILSKIIPIIIFFLLIKLIFAYVTAIISYQTWIDWWNKTGGKQFNTTFDIYSMACFNYSNLLFKVRQNIVAGSASLNETDILLLQSIVFNNAKVIPNKILSKNFTTPVHVCQGIAWNNEDILIFQQAIDYWYSQTKDVTGSWYNAWNDAAIGNRCGPDDGPSWTKIMKTINGFTGTCGGFWPHQNNCYNFFDITNNTIGNTTYNLTDNIAKSWFIGKVGIYQPGTGQQSSWAQLFADFGIVYTTATNKTNTTVPFLDPSHKIELWYSSGQINSGDNTTYGPNFFGTYFINPSSYVLTSWVSGLYDDPTTGIIFDPQAIKNLIGMNPGASKSSTGGWVKFLKGFNTNITSYDAIMNDLFATYTTNYTTKPDSAKDNSCSTGAKASSMIGGAVSLGSIPLFLGKLLPFPLNVIAAVAGAGVGAWQGSYNSKC
jgi:hypothetical protein